jgi:hypothetical protein
MRDYRCFRKPWCYINCQTLFTFYSWNPSKQPTFWSLYFRLRSRISRICPAWLGWPLPLHRMCRRSCPTLWASSPLGHSFSCGNMASLRPPFLYPSIRSLRPRRGSSVRSSRCRGLRRLRSSRFRSFISASLLLRRWSAGLCISSIRRCLSLST